MQFSRQEHWSPLPFPSPGDLPDPGIKPSSPTLQADSLLSKPPGELQAGDVLISPLLLSTVDRVLNKGTLAYQSGKGAGFSEVYHYA